MVRVILCLLVSGIFLSKILNGILKLGWSMMSRLNIMLIINKIVIGIL